MLHIEEATESKTVTCKITGEGQNGTVKTLDKDGNVIFHVKSNKSVITFTCEEKDTTLDLSGLTLNTKAGVIRTSRTQKNLKK